MSVVWEESYNAVCRQISKAEAESGREPGAVKLLVTSKSQEAVSIRQLYELGQHHFAENYLQEALKKKKELVELAIIWHFIGHIQTRKAKAVAENFSWVHSVDSEKIALLLDGARGKAGLLPLQVCLQVNVSDDPAKGGVSPDQVVLLYEAVTRLPHLCIRGLMTILRADESPEESLASYQKLASLLGGLNDQGCGLDTLSMGMSSDFPLAIAAGATWVRIGQALFGKRNG
jgi:pyridoxal phosphate enzyme (YggS family)